MSQEKVELFVDAYWVSPYSYSVYTALKEKKIAFEVHDAPYRDHWDFDPKLGVKTYTDLIPVLRHGDLVLSESLAMLEYLEEVFPSSTHPRLFPTDVKARARARFLLSWHRCYFQALRDERSAETMFYDDLRAKKPLSPAAREEVETWKKALRDLLKPGSEFLFGQWTIADSETAFMLHRLIRNGDEIDADLKAYAANIWKRPSMAEFVERRRPAFN